jgi:tyrosyl-tRNA synthetase
MTLSEELSWRGFVNQTTLENITDLDTSAESFYWGVDPSSESMQIGNLAAAMMVRHFIDYGHKAYLLVGGATGMIGDPDGKADERNLKTFDEIEKNKTAIAKQYRQVFAGKDFELVDNYDWFKNLNYLDFLREVGKNVPMSQMLGREFIQSRLGEGGSGISYAEFSYSLIQGYDFLHLYRNHGVTLQVCGADQWGNSIAGVELIRRIDGGSADIYSTPLVINKATGRKFGKSEGGAVWLDENKTSVYQFYQFWLNVDDDGVIDYAKIYTLLTRDELQELADRHAESPEKRLAQKRLAYEVTAIVHGADRADSVEKVTDVLFGNSSIESLSDRDLEELAKEIPVIKSGLSVTKSLIESGLSASNGEARRLLAGGAISVNGQKMTDDIVIDGLSLLKKGKNSFLLIR